MNPATKRFIDIVTSQVYFHENGGNNRGEVVTKYQLATTLQPGAWPWCAAFVAWCLQQWLEFEENRTAINLSQIEINSWRCKSAKAFDWIKWAKHHKLFLLDKHQRAKAGDIVVFEFSHIGIVLEDQLHGDDTITTIEGNTNANGERESLHGDGVWKKRRKTSSVLSYIRLLP